MKEVAKQKWAECLAIIKERLGNDAAYATWFEPTRAVSLQGNWLTLRLSSGFVKELYEGKYFDIFSYALRSVFGKSVGITYDVPVVKDAKGGSMKMRSTPSEPQPVAQPELRTPAGQTAAAPKSSPAPSASEQWMPQLNTSLSFENYCVGSCNKLPWSIAASIARNPVNSSFNPFFLYGSVGVGKTHLMQAIGLRVKQAYPEKRVVFLQMKEFQRLYQNAHLQDKIPAFLQWFMQCDVLLFDDLQEIVGSKGTLNNALFPIFSHLQMHGKQLVFTCDRPPQDLKEIEDRLIDRFKWGVVEKLEKPDTALRKKILNFKARKTGLELPSEVIDYIAGSNLNSVREIESIVVGIMARAINLGINVDMELAKVVVERATRTQKSKTLNFDMIVEAVAEHYKLNADVLFSKSRLKDVAEARMAVMYLAQRLLGLGTGAIGRKLGRKHSTVIHGIKTMTAKADESPDFAETLALIEKNL